MRISPSVLSCDFAHIASEMQVLDDAGVDMVHVDVMDGVFVPNLSFGAPIIAAMRRHSALPFDVHLMMQYPDRLLDAFIDAGADIVERLQRFGAVLVPVLHGKCLSLVQEDLGIAQYDPVLSRAARDPRLVSVYEVFAQVITRYGRSGGSGVFIGLVSVLAANEAFDLPPHPIGSVIENRGVEARFTVRIGILTVFLPGEIAAVACHFIAVDQFAGGNESRINLLA